MAYSYKGSLSFGLVYIPIQLQKCVVNKDIGFNMLDKQTMSRVKYKKTCVNCDGRELTQDDIVKGYRYDDENYIIFEDSDFEKIKTQKDKNITITQFIDLQDIDPIYYDTPYYVIPTGAENAYSLLLKAMQDENKVGIAKCVLGTKETLIAIRAREGQLCLNTMYFYDEIQPAPSKGAHPKQSDKELEIAKLIIRNMSAPFQPENYKDEYRLRLEQAIEAKIAGKEIQAPKEAPNRVADLMDALQKTLKTASKPAFGNFADKKPTAPAPKSKRTKQSPSA